MICSRRGSFYSNKKSRIFILQAILRLLLALITSTFKDTHKNKSGGLDQVNGGGGGHTRFSSGKLGDQTRFRSGKCGTIQGSDQVNWGGGGNIQGLDQVNGGTMQCSDQVNGGPYKVQMRLMGGGGGKQGTDQSIQ